MQSLRELSEGAAQESRLYRTPAFPAGSGPDFVNACMVILTTKNAHDLLSELHRIEALAKRTRNMRWGPRTLDVDLIALAGDIAPNADTQRAWQDLPLDDQLRQTPNELILPHPRVQDRGFVLVPMLEVAADWEHPVRQETIAQMAARLTPEDLADIVPLDAAITP